MAAVRDKLRGDSPPAGFIKNPAQAGHIRVYSFSHSHGFVSICFPICVHLCKSEWIPCSMHLKVHVTAR